MIDVGQSYLQRVVEGRRARLWATRRPRPALIHFAYEKVGAVAAHGARPRHTSVSEEDADGHVKVSGRKGLGVKADDLLDALHATRRASEVDARDRGARPPDGAASARPQIATGALRYFMLKFSRTKIITFDMEEALTFEGETGPYVQNAVVRARNIFAKLEDAGHERRGAARAGARASISRVAWTGEEGDEIFALLMLVARSEEVVQQVVDSEGEVAILAKHAFMVAQAFHSYYQKPKYSLVHAENDDPRALRTSWYVFVRQMEVIPPTCWAFRFRSRCEPADHRHQHRFRCSAAGAALLAERVRATSVAGRGGAHAAAGRAGRTPARRDGSMAWF